MPDLQVSNDVDSFVQSADTAGMRANLGMAFYYQNQAAPVVCSDVYQDLITLNLTAVPDGTYVITVTSQWVYSSTTKSAFFRVNVNGEGWQEFTRLSEVDQIVTVSGVPRVFTGGSVTIALQAKKESATGTMTVEQSAVTLERKI